MPQPYDIQLPDILGQYQRGWDMAEHRKRAPIESAQRDQVFENTQLDRRDDEIGVVAGLIASAQTPEDRARVYAQAAPKIAPLAQRYGIQMPPVWDERLLPEVQHLQQIFQTRRNNGGSDIPADIQTMEYYKNNPDQFERQIELRRAAANPFAFDWKTGPDGTPQLIRQDKREGVASVAAIDSAPSALPTMPQGDFAATATAIAEKHGFRPTSIARTPAENAKLPHASANSRHLSGNAIDVSIRGKSPQELAALDADMRAAGFEGGIHLEGSYPHMHYSRKPGGSFTARSPEAEAAAVEAAKENAKFGVDQTRAGFDANQAARVAGATAEGKGRAENLVQAQVDLPGAIAGGTEALKVVDDLLNHPGRIAATGLSARVDPRNIVPGTDAYDFRAMSKKLEGKAFLQAFEKLKGGGQITEIEGKKATDAIIAMDQAQSEKQYEKGLRDFRDVILSGLQRARDKAKGGAQGKQVKRTGTHNGRKVVEYTDGTVSYAD